MTLDTGTNHTLLFTDVEPVMHNTRKSNARIGVANSGSMGASMRGSLHTLVLDIAANPGISPLTSFTIPNATTVPELSKELFSVDDFFRYHKYNILLRQPDYENGISELYRPAAPGRPESRIPLLYDYYGNGGWKMFYVPSKGMTKDDMKVLTQHMHDYIEDRSPEACNAFRASLMTPCQARCMHKSLQCHAAVRDVEQCMWGEHQVRPDTCIEVPSDHHEHAHNDLAPSSKESNKDCKVDVIYGKHPCEREIKGTCTSLRFGISKMSHKDRHTHFKKFELTKDQHISIARMCIEAGVDYGASVWDLEMLRWIDPYLKFYKIAMFFL